VTGRAVLVISNLVAMSETLVDVLKMHTEFDVERVPLDDLTPSRSCGKLKYGL
jgi:hypothetical protein